MPLQTRSEWIATVIILALMLCVLGWMRYTTPTYESRGAPPQPGLEAR